MRYYLNERNWPMIIKKSYYDASDNKKHTRKLRQRIHYERQYGSDLKRSDFNEHIENAEKMSQLLKMIQENRYEEKLIQLSSFDRYLDDWDFF